MSCHVGEILPVHVTTHPAKSDEQIVSEISNLLSGLPRERATIILQKVGGADIVGACAAESIWLFIHLLTADILKCVHDLYDSRQLNDIVRDLFRHLAKDETLTVGVKISAGDFKKCEDGFAEYRGLGMCIAVLGKCYLVSVTKSYKSMHCHHHITLSSFCHLL